jgi:hypothetical protein
VLAAARIAPLGFFLVKSWATQDNLLATWPPSSTGASQHSRIPTHVRCPGSPAYQKRSMLIPSGPYLAKRSQLVADLADHVQDHACQRDAEPIWAAAGTHHSALVGEIAMWRTANGINPQDPRSTGGTQLETLPAPLETAPRPAYRPIHRCVRQREA